MTLPRFLDCAFTLLFDEYQRAGQDLLTAMEKLGQWTEKPVEQPATVNVAVRNTSAMAAFQSMMAGVRRR